MACYSYSTFLYLYVPILHVHVALFFFEFIAWSAMLLAVQTFKLKKPRKTAFLNLLLGVQTLKKAFLIHFFHYNFRLSFQ